MAFTIEDMRRLAELSRLDVTEDQMPKRMQELERVLGYVNRLAEVDVTGVPEGGTVPERQAWRQDVAFPSDDVTHDLIIQNFPDRHGPALRVPAVFDKPKG